MQFLDHTEVSHLAAAIDERYRSLIFTAAYTGLRWGELAGLRSATGSTCCGGRSMSSKR